MAVGSIPFLPQLTSSAPVLQETDSSDTRVLVERLTPCVTKWDVTIQGGTCSQDSAKSQQEQCPTRTKAQSWHRAGSVFLEHRVSVAEGGTLLEFWWVFFSFFLLLPPSFPFPNTPKGK